MISMRSASLRAPAGSAACARAGPSTHARFGWRSWTLKSTVARASSHAKTGQIRACVRVCERALLQQVEGLMEEKKKKELLALIFERS